MLTPIKVLSITCFIPTCTKGKSLVIYLIKFAVTVIIVLNLDLQKIFERGYSYNFGIFSRNVTKMH